MATKLVGRINLSKIDKRLITEDKHGNKVLWVDVIPRRTVGTYGETHTITTYDKEKKETIYLADLQPKEFGNDGASQASVPPQGNAFGEVPPISISPYPSAPQGSDDLPF